MTVNALTSANQIEKILDRHQPAGTQRGHLCVCGVTVTGSDRTGAWNTHRAQMLAAAGFEQTVNGTHPGTLDKVARQVGETCPGLAKTLTTQASVFRGAMK